MTKSNLNKILMLCVFIGNNTVLQASDSEDKEYSQYPYGMPASQKHLAYDAFDDFLREEAEAEATKGHRRGGGAAAAAVRFADDEKEGKVKSVSGHKHRRGTSSAAALDYDGDSDSSEEEMNRAKRGRTDSARDVGLSSLASKFSSKMKQSIAQYIPQVVHISVATDNSTHTGTGFIFDALKGVIATNMHVATGDFVNYKIKMHNGTVYRSKDVKILGTTPSATFGDFAFLQVDSLASVFEQMPIAAEHNVSKHDPVAFMGNSHGHFSVEEGNLNAMFDFGLQKTVHSIQVQLFSRGGSSGSPTFNDRGEINGILFGGDDVHTVICPIFHLRRAYEQMMAIPGRISPIVTRTLGSVYDTIHINTLAEYHKIDESLLKNYLPKDQLEELNFIEFTHPYSAIGSDTVQANDVLLTVNGEKIGCDTIKLTKILDANDRVDVEVLRLGKIIKLSVVPYVAKQMFAKRITTDEEAFIEVTPAFHYYRYPMGAAVLASKGTEVYEIGEDGEGEEFDGRVGSVAGTEVKTFDDVARALYENYTKKGDEHFLIGLIDGSEKPAGVSSLDLSGLSGQPLTVHLFDEILRHWRKMSLAEYVASLDKDAAAAPAKGGAGV